MAKAVFLSGYITIGGTTIYVTNIDWNETSKMLDVTDLSNTLGTVESIADTKKVSFTCEGWKDIGVALPTRGTEASLTINMEGYTFSGDAIISECTVNAVFDTAIKLSLSGVFNGTVTENEVT